MTTRFPLTKPNQPLTSPGRSARFPSTTARSKIGSEGSSPSSRPLIVDLTVSVTVEHQVRREGMKRIDGLWRFASTNSWTHAASIVREESPTSVARSSVWTWNPSRWCRTAAPT